jgi:catechol 2,3-dioxygenase
MATDQLDIDGLLALTATHTTNYATAPDNLRIGHMHLRVGDLEQADRFYSGTIGFAPTRKRRRRRVPVLGALSPFTSRSTSGRAPAQARADDTATGLRGFR